ncbi:MAG: hypothetical protein Kapaf2KO_16370 [Candidatus Kapaibacteriales bacterium]
MERLSYSIRIFKSILIIICLSVFSTSCEDELPTTYQPQYFIEAFLESGNPIEDIRIIRSAPINVEFDYSNQLVRDAVVIITDNSGREFTLEIAEDGEQGYFFADTSYKVQVGETYSLNVEFADGKSASGVTTVPDTFSWVQRAPDFIDYPTETEIDTAEVKVSWTKTGFYLLKSTALDTLEYGKYLEVPTDERNIRIPNEFREDSFYDNTTVWGFLPTNRTVVVWTALRWYGLHELALYRADPNMISWFLQARGAQQFNELLNTIDGDAFGAFGSASVIRDTSMFLFP